MSRLEKKCLFASTGAHALIAFLLCIAPFLWVSHRHEFVTLPVLTLIPSRLVDGASGGGGSPTATEPPAPAPAAPAQPLTLAAPVAQPPVRVAPPKPEPKPETKPDTRPAVQRAEPAPKPRTRKGADPVATTKPTVKPDEDDGARSKPNRRKIQISFARDTSGSSKQAAEARRQEEARARAAQAQFASRVRSIAGALGQSMSKGTSIEVPGAGGEAYADYGQFVELFYRRAWSQPADVADDLATVKVRVVIRRDGKVDSFKIIKPSGHAPLDSSVRRLENLDFVQPFPEGAKDATRAFVINFNLKAER